MTPQLTGEGVSALLLSVQFTGCPDHARLVHAEQTVGDSLRYEVGQRRVVSFVQILGLHSHDLQDNDLFRTIKDKSDQSITSYCTGGNDNHVIFIAFITSRSAMLSKHPFSDKEFS